MNGYFTPNEERFFASTDSATIQNAIAAAEADGCREVHIPRYNARTDRNEWRISEVIRVPDHFTVILDNCYMVQETGVIANLFANSRFDDVEYITKAENEQRDITILGRGNAICDGGVHNGLLEKTNRKFGYPYLWGNNMFLWINVNGLRVENLRIQNQRFWSMNHAYCRNVHIKNINFHAVPHVPNMDGIDFRTGCNNITVENISGRTGDDVIALTALPFGHGETYWRVAGKDQDIHDASIRNVRGDPYIHHVVRLLNQDGCKIYNIDVNTVMDTSDYRTKKRPLSTLSVGSSNYAHAKSAASGDLHHITAQHITSRGEQATKLACTVEDSSFTDFKTFGDAVNGVTLMDFCDFRNVVFDGIYYGVKQSEIFTSRALPPEKFNGTVLNFAEASGEVTVRNVFAGQAQRLLHLSGPVRFYLGKCRADFVNTQVQVEGAARLIREEE